MLSLEEASDRLGLTADFLEWAISNELLKGVNQNNGEWAIPSDEIEAGFDLIDSELVRRSRSSQPERLPPDQEETNPESSKPTSHEAETKEPSGAVMAAPTNGNQPQIANSTDDEVRQLRSLLQEKDQLIADLSRSLSRMGEAALAELAKKG